MKRLTHGLSRKEDGEEMPAPPRLRPADPGFDPEAAQPRRPLGQEAALYAPRGGQLDPHGRAHPDPLAQQPADPDDQLEIPAFLRRQAQ